MRTQVGRKGDLTEEKLQWKALWLLPFRRDTISNIYQTLKTQKLNFVNTSISQVYGHGIFRVICDCKRWPRGHIVC
jgi:hypothetical protein